MKPTESLSPLSELLTHSELALQLGCTERHIYDLRKRGLPVIRVGRLVRFDPAAVRRWMEEVGDDSAPVHLREAAAEKS